MKRLQIVIVNYNVGHLLASCLQSVYAQWPLQKEELEVTVVDNASTDEDTALVPGRFPQANFIWNKENVGFSKACNQAIRQSQSEYVLLLNPDTTILYDLFSPCLSFLDARPKTGAVGVRMFDGDGHYLRESLRGFPTFRATFGRLTHLEKFCRKGGVDGYYVQPKPSPQRVEILAGAFMMLRREALLGVGLLDEDYFMYGEDIQLCCQLHEKGYDCYSLPCRMEHLKGQSAHQYPKSYIKNFYGAMIIFLRKNRKRYSPILTAFAILFLWLYIYLKTR